MIAIFVFYLITLASARKPVTIHLTSQASASVLENKFWKVSDPDSTEYRRFPHVEEIESLVRASDRCIYLLKTFLKNPHYHFSELKNRVYTSVSDQEYQQLKQRMRSIDQVIFVNSMVPECASAIEIGGLMTFNGHSNPIQMTPMDNTTMAKPDPAVLKKLFEYLVKTAQDLDQDPMVQKFKTYPQLLRDAYGIGNYVGNSEVKGEGVSHSYPSYSQAVTALGSQVFDQQGYNAFIKYLYPEGQDTPFKTKFHDFVPIVTRILTGKMPESMIDAEWIVVTGTGIRTEFWGFNSDESFVGAFDRLVETVVKAARKGGDYPRVFSTSYGMPETNKRHPIEANRIKDLIDTNFQILGLLGISILFASGDSGAGHARFDPWDGQGSPFMPMYPGTSPFVTSVGGTRFPESGKPTVGWVFSSGGFSDRYDMPNYQKGTADAYLTHCKNCPNSNWYRSTGRGFPDLAAAAENVPIFGDIYGTSDYFGIKPMGGTSCASPIVAGIIGLLNDVLAQKGEPPLGFLNPLLYKMKKEAPSTIKDVTIGGNIYVTSNGTALIPHLGWKAAKSWDPVTGLGIPNFSAMKTYIMKLDKHPTTLSKTHMVPENVDIWKFTTLISGSISVVFGFILMLLLIRTCYYRSYADDLLEDISLYERYSWDAQNELDESRV